MSVLSADDSAASVASNVAAAKAPAAKVEHVIAAIFIRVGVKALPAFVAYACQFVRTAFAEHVLVAAQHR